MSNEISGWGASPSIAPSWSQESASARSRFQEARDAFANPDLQEKAKRFASNVGSEAVKGALENAGVAKYDDEGKMKIRKFGAVKAVLRPQHTARKAAVGAVEGARSYAKEQAVGAARQNISELYAGATTPAIEQSAAPAGWGVTPNTAPSSGWGQPVETAPTPPAWGAAPEAGYGQYAAPAAQANAGRGATPNAAAQATGWTQVAPNQAQTGWGPPAGR